MTNFNLKVKVRKAKNQQKTLDYFHNKKLDEFNNEKKNIEKYKKIINNYTKELNELNKQTISYMINSLKKSNNENNQTTSIENLDYQDTNTEFSKREKEYEILKNNTKMNEKPNFNQTIEDKAIDNMEELLYSNHESNIQKDSAKFKKREPH